MTRIPSVFEVSSVSEFLEKFTNLLKKIYGSEFVAEWARRTGISSRITFRKYIKNKRVISDAIKEKISETLDLSSLEKERLLSLDSKAAEPTFAAANEFFVSEDFFASPINTLILNLCGIETSMHHQKISSILQNIYSEEEIEKSIALLIGYKLVEKKIDGILSRCFEGSLTTVPGHKQLSSKKYFQSSYQLADLAWESSLMDRELNAFTFRMDHKDILKVKSLVRHFRRELSQLQAKETKSDSVYHCSVAVFPVFTPEKPGPVVARS